MTVITIISFIPLAAFLLLVAATNLAQYRHRASLSEAQREAEKEEQRAWLQAW